ncbi:MAG: PIN domain-containing protein [Acidobacteria bacterium]|nr:PIN domain-containing protein [Acidobacteriota bacterium]MBI3657944.1 PIN domain-containing protein [Acidobacteriota bacterium]
MVIADTSVWISFFNRPASREKRTLDVLIDSDETAMIGVVLTEILQGCRSPKERGALKETILALPYVDMTQSVWIRAGEISSALLRRGITVPIPDLIVAGVALEHQFEVYSLDKHFQKIPGLALYTPAIS